MLETFIEGNRVRIGERFSVSFQRTLRIPDDDSNYPLPPGLGSFPVHRVEEFQERATDKMSEYGGVFIPMYQREALWLGFDAAEWKPNAVKVSVGKVNAVSGEPWNEKLSGSPQDYVVCPKQPWLDGINAGDGYIRQFVAMPLGLGYTVEAQITGQEVAGGIQILAFEPKPGLFPDEPPEEPDWGLDNLTMMSPEAATETHMGVGAGGRMTQKLYPDPYGIETWDQSNFGSLFVHIVNSEQFHHLTGLEPPPTPVSAKTYTEFGLPWFELYDEKESDLQAPEHLAAILSVGQKDARNKTPGTEGERPLNISHKQVKVIDDSKLKKR